ncbi:tape measure protein [Massilia sp. CCM 8695]|uniref:Tape measure protein n=1 Tax=Massilia frigida TaxID=2609281 RepID=A0ABX0NE83_9BURK|nr:tape measure protein [Massilia frigida]NHZ83777.1 tape measure protein [Massilia frigida]
MIVGDMEIRLRADIARLQQDMDMARRVVSDSTMAMGRAADVLKGALAGVFGGVGLAQLIQLSDTYAKFTAQLRLASTSTREYAVAYADVKRVATTSQQSLAETGVLYARIANGTRELGTSQKQVAAITEVVNLSLKVSGAAASESASAQLQLSQAFSSGTLRGEEFNAVNEAAPRLMKALADGMGMPVGALKKMAEEGQITSNIMATVLPDALEKLRVEAAQVQTIGGAFTVLKNNVMELVGVQANASGAVSALTGAIGLLSSNLAGVAWAMTTMIAIKTTTWLASLTTDAFAAVAAKRALATATLQAAVTTTQAAAVAAAAKLTEAQANVSATASTAALTTARVAELRAAVLAAQGTAALAITTNGLIPAQARAAAAAEAHAVALAAQAVAAGGATTASIANTAAITAQVGAASLATRAMGMLRGALTLVGGPIGAIIIALSAGALAWSKWGKDAKESNETALESFDDAHARIVKGLDEQIDKNEKLLRLKNLGMSTAGAEKAIPVTEQLGAASRRLNALNTRTGEFDPNKTGMSNNAIDREREKVMKNILELTQKMQKAEQTSAAVAAQTTNERVVAFKKEYATKDEQMKAELKSIEDLKGKTAEYDMMVKRIQDKYADKGNAAAIRKEATAYQNLITSIAEKVAANKLELDGNDKLTESQKMTIKLNAEIKTGKTTLSKASIEGARAEIAMMSLQEDAIAAQAQSLALKDNVAKASAKSDEETFDRINNERKALDDQTKALEHQIEVFGKTEVAVVDLAIAKAQAALDAGPATYAEMFALNEKIAKLEKIRELTVKKVALDLGAGGGVAAAKDLLEIMTAIDEVTKSAAAGMAESFGRVGTAIGELTTALSGYARAQAAIDAELKKSTKDAGGDQAMIQRANAIAAQRSAQLQVRSYGDMASAAKGFFKENTAGYKVLHGAEKAFRAYEMALAIQNMLAKSGLLTAFTSMFVTSKATETAATVASVAPDVAASMTKGAAAAAVGVATQAQGEPCTAWARMAAMAAVMASLGFAVAGGGGSGGGQSSADAQKLQGTGSVFGDTDAKSESIARSLAMLEDHSGSLVPINRGMLTALRAIEASMKGLSDLIVRAPGVADGTNLEIQTGQLNIGKATDGISKVMTEVTKGVFGPGLGGKIAGFVNNLWGKTTRNIVDSGIQFGGSVRDLQGGRGFDQYASVNTTTSSYFGLKKSTTNAPHTAALGGELPAQFGLVFKGVETALLETATVLGIGADHVKKSLDGLTIDETKISLKGLTGDALTEALNAVLSKTMDDMSAAVFPQMDAFRQVGEGYTETIVRLASNYGALDHALSSIGMTFGATGIGSLAARENLIDLAGGIDTLSEQASSFAENFLSDAERLAPVQKYVTDELARLGQSGIKTRDDFKAAVVGLSQSGALATKAGSEMYTGLMSLQEAFAAVVPALEKTRTAAEKLTERNGLIDQRDELTMTPHEMGVKRRNGVDQSNWDLYDEVENLTKAKTLAETNKKYLDQIDALATSTRSLSEQRAREIVGMDASTVEIIKRRNALQDEAAAATLAATNRKIEIQNMELSGNKLGAVAAARADELVGLDASTAALIKNRNALQDQAAAADNAVAGAGTALSNVKSAVERDKAFLEQEYQRKVDDLKARADGTKEQISAVNARADAVRGVFDKLNDALASTVIEVNFFDRAQRRSAQELLARAAITTRGGGTADIQGLDEALATIAKPSQQLFSSFEEWARDQARTGSNIAALKNNAKAEIDFAALTVDAINKAAGAAQAGGEAQLRIMAEQHAAEMAAQDSIVTTAQAQLDQARGLNTTLLSIADALLAFGVAVQAVKDAPPPLSVEGLFQKVLGRKGEKSGIDFWTKAYGDSVDNTELADFIKAARPELDARKNGTLAEFLRTHGVPGYANGGDFGGGVRLVGEHGPELEATGPARIFDANQTRSMLNGGGNADVVAELREVRRELAELRTPIEQTAVASGKSAGSTDQLAKQFNNVSAGGNLIRVKVIPA